MQWITSSIFPSLLPYVTFDLELSNAKRPQNLRFSGIIQNSVLRNLNPTRSEWVHTIKSFLVVTWYVHNALLFRLTIEGLCVFSIRRWVCGLFWAAHIYVSLDPKVATGSRVQNSCAAICIWCRGGEELPGSVLIERYSNNVYKKGTDTNTHKSTNTNTHTHTQQMARAK